MTTLLQFFFLERFHITRYVLFGFDRHGAPLELAKDFGRAKLAKTFRKTDFSARWLFCPASTRK